MYSIKRNGILTILLSLFILSDVPTKAEATEGPAFTPIELRISVEPGVIPFGEIYVTFEQGYPFPDQCIDPGYAYFDDEYGYRYYDYVDYCLSYYPNYFYWGNGGFFFNDYNGFRHFWHHDHGKFYGREGKWLGHGRDPRVGHHGDRHGDHHGAALAGAAGLAGAAAAHAGRHRGDYHGQGIGKHGGGHNTGKHGGGHSMGKHGGGHNTGKHGGGHSMGKHGGGHSMGKHGGGRGGHGGHHR